MYAESASDYHTIGSRVREPLRSVVVEATSTPDWGHIERIGIGIGVVGEPKERWRWFRPAERPFSIEREIRMPLSKPGYVRAEVWTSGGASALTNPILILEGDA